MDKITQDIHSKVVGHNSRDTIKAVAIYEVIKGLGGLSGTFALWRWHSHLLDWLSAIETFWLARFGSLFSAQVEALIRLAERATSQWQWFLLLLMGYTLIRFIEAYGLWQDRTWAYWLSVFNYGILIPFEVYYLLVHPFDWVKFVVFILNILVVYVVYRNMRLKGLI